MSVPVPATAAEEGKLLSEALNTVKVQVQQMKRHLELDQLMDALKSASLMLAELRTSSLSPKQYYELYMAVFDALRHLSNYLYDAHTQGRHHLADLYELVQYAGNIVPRLYLMITVGSVYMSVPDAPVKEIMKDMMEMSRGVLHPIRGLFLRHYLSGQTRDHLPVGEDNGPAGNLQDSISFLLTNFIEMNKLWVRLQHQGHSRDREKRDLERRELRILVGTNLVRLSHLEGVDLALYSTHILPSILEQIVSCRDVIAQEYLMEVLIQVFSDEFHLHTLGEFLRATAVLSGRVSVKGIVIALVDRLAAYAAREAEAEDPEETRRQEEEAAKRLAEKVKARKGGATYTVSTSSTTSSLPSEAGEWGGGDSSSSPIQSPVIPETPTSPSIKGKEKSEDASGALVGGGEGAAATANKPPVKKFRGIPEDVQLFEVFWKQIVELIKARPDLSIQDITALLVSLTNLSLSCYPDRLEYVDQILAFAKDKIVEFKDNPDLHSPPTTTHLSTLLLSPISSYQSPLTLLALPSYSPLLRMQLYATRKQIAHAVVAAVLRTETVIGEKADVEGILGLCAVLVRGEEVADVGGGGEVEGNATGGVDSGTSVGDGGLPLPPPSRGGRRMGGAGGQQPPLEREEMAEEQGWVARMVHLFRSDSLDVQFELLQVARKHFEAGGERMRFTFPALINSAIKLVRRYKNREHLDPNWRSSALPILKFARQLTSILSTHLDAPTLALPLFLLAAQVADECGGSFDEMAYDLYVQAFSTYEEGISESRRQLEAIGCVIGVLAGARGGGGGSGNGLGGEGEEGEGYDYDTLITKAALHGAKLLKRSHQATAVGWASHLWWQEEATAHLVSGSEGGAAKSQGVNGSNGDEGAVKERRKGEGFNSYPHQDSKRVLECLQKSLRIANSAIEEIVTVQLYCDTLDQYLYYLDHGAPAVAPKFVNSLVDLITASIDNVTTGSADVHPSQLAPPGLIEGVHTPEMIIRHFRNTLCYIQRRKHAFAEGGEGAMLGGAAGGWTAEQLAAAGARWEEVDVVGALLKMGIGR